MMQQPQVILVDEHDREIGFDDKLSVHRGGGQLHRAFSVLISNTAGQMLLQLRAAGKYHFGGLWTNACCGHPSRGQSVLVAASARLQEEFGFCAPLRETFSFQYEAHDPTSGLTEREFDHVLEGTFDGDPKPDPKEIDDFRWVEQAELLHSIETQPSIYTPWFRILLEKRAASR